MAKGKIEIPRDQIVELCKRYYIRKLSLFGSVLRDDFGPKSDIDLLVEFEPGHTPGFSIIDIEEEFSKIFGGRKVDIINPKYINHRLKDNILSNAEVQYAKG